jgi:hypothetical protein
MRVVSLVNGSLLSEAASFYAIIYAKAMQLPLTLLFIDDGRESVEKWQLSVASLKELAVSQEIEVESLTLQGEVLSQLHHFSRLYAIDTLFCATRKLSKHHSFSDKIVGAGLETDIAVVKIKNISKIRSYQRVFFAAGEHPNLHAYLLWLGLLQDGEIMGELCLAGQERFKSLGPAFTRQYTAKPFMQLARMLQRNVEIESTLLPHDAEQIDNYLLANGFDLALFDASAYPQKLLNQVTDEAAVNTIQFYPWKV